MGVLCVVITGFGANLYGQCDPPGEVPTPQCVDAPITCLSNACYSTDNVSNQGHSEFCGDFTLVHNPQYFAFIATDTTVTIAISIDNCTGGTALQSAIIEIQNDQAGCTDWVNDDVIVCDPGFSGATTMTAEPLIIGNTYLLLIDGSNGATCQYTIDQADGIFEPSLQGDLDQALTGSIPSACPGDSTWEAWTGPPIGEAHGYIWAGFPWGDVTSTTVNLNNTTAGFNGIPPDAEPGIYTVCVTPFSGCDTGTVKPCFEFEIFAVDDFDAPPVIHCPEEYVDGILWGTMTINGPGTVTQEFYTPEGCPYDSIKLFEAYPDVTPGQIDTVICGQELVYEGMTYTTADAYDLFYGDGSINGCDSTAVLNVDFAYIEAEPAFVCDFGTFVITSNPSGLVPSSGVAEYLWRDSTGAIVSTDEDWMTEMSGLYILEISVVVNGVTCVFPNDGSVWSVDIVLADIVPDAPVFIQADTVICSLEIGVYAVEPGVPGDILDYIWQVPLDATIVSGDGTDELAIDWSSSIGGEICVFWTNHCGESEMTCIEVRVIPQPLALFDIVVTACTDEIVIVEFNGIATDAAEYFWDFGAGTIVSGGPGPGPYEISWGTTGTHEVILKLLEPGCDTSMALEEIMIESLGAPQIGCTSTTSSVTFSWISVPGSTGFEVNVLDGSTGIRLDDTTYEVTGLANGEGVTLEVVALGNGVCPAQRDTLECFAEDCPPINGGIDDPGLICENDPPFNLTATVEGSAVVGMWSGPGITDPVNGTFDPAIAGPGMHQIGFVYDNGLCPYSFPLTIEVFAQPTADFVADMNVCEDADVNVTYMGAAGAGAMYTWDFDNGQVQSGVDQGPYVITWNTPGTKTITLTVVENGCTSELFSQMVVLDPLLGDIDLSCSTSTTSITFSWDDVLNAVMHEVVILSGPSGVRTGNTYTVDGLSPGDMVKLQLTATGSGMCPPVIDSIECEAQDCPAVVIEIGPMDTTMCLYTSTSAFDMQVNVTGGSGAGEWSGTGITPSGTFDPVAVGAGVYIVTYTYVDQSCQFPAQTSIEVYDVPQAVISNTDLILTCANNNELSLDGTQSSAALGAPVFLWSTSDGFLVTRPDSMEVIAGAAGTYQLVVTDPVSGCSDSTSVTLQKDANSPIADAGEDKALDCLVTVVELGGASSSGPSIEYLWSTADGNIMTDPTLAMITVDAAGVYDLLVSDVSNGCNTPGSVVVTQDIDTPVPMVDVSGILTCEVQKVTISSTIVGGNGNYDYSWTTTDGTIDGAANGPDIVVISPGFYELVVTDQKNGCKDSIEVEVMADSGVIASLDIEQNDPTCFGDFDGKIAIVQVNGGSMPFVYAWSTGATGTAITDLTGGDFGVTVTDNNGCSFVQSFTLVEPAKVTADLGADITVNRGDSVVILLNTNVDPGAVANIVWSGPVPPCDNCLSQSFIAEISGLVEASVTDTNGCFASTQLQLNVISERNVFAPNVFSPNDDGINDYFNLFGSSIANVNTIQVFDRWGNLVYSEDNVIPNDVNKGWDGTWNGEEMLPGVYVFYAEVVHDDGGFNEEIIGDITLIR